MSRPSLNPNWGDIEDDNNSNNSTTDSLNNGKSTTNKNTAQTQSHPPGGPDTNNNNNQQDTLNIPQHKNQLNLYPSKNITNNNTTSAYNNNNNNADNDINSATAKLQQASVSNDDDNENDDDDDDEAVLPIGGLHPNDQTAQVEIINHSNNIYKAAESFESLNIPSDILRGIYDMKFSSPSKIQAQALPIILDKNNKNNLIGQAQHGSGKTATFCLGVLCQIDTTSKTAQAVIVTPTRELALQITDVAKNLAKYTEITISSVVPRLDLPDGPITYHVLVGK